MNQLNAIILAAGFGTRLNGAINLPKGLIKSAGSTLLGHIIQDIQQTKPIAKTTLITNTKYHSQYRDWLKATFPDFPITIINNHIATNDKRLGALGDLIHALDHTNGWSQDTLVLPSDTYYSFALNDLINFYSQHQGFVTVIRSMDKAEIKNRLGCAVLDNSQITQFIEKPANPPSNFAAIPFYIYPANHLSLLKDYQQQGGNLDAPGSIIPWLINNDGPVYAMIVDTPTIDVGTPPDIKTLKDLESSQHDHSSSQS